MSNPELIFEPKSVEFKTRAMSYWSLYFEETVIQVERVALQFCGTKKRLGFLISVTIK